MRGRSPPSAQLISTNLCRWKLYTVVKEIAATGQWSLGNNKTNVACLWRRAGNIWRRTVGAIFGEICSNFWGNLENRINWTPWTNKHYLKESMTGILLIFLPNIFLVWWFGLVPFLVGDDGSQCWNLQSEWSSLVSSFFPPNAPFQRRSIDASQ